MTEVRLSFFLNPQNKQPLTQVTTWHPPMLTETASLGLFIRYTATLNRIKCLHNPPPPKKKVIQPGAPAVLPNQELSFM